MSHNPENLPERVKNIRKANQRSIHDCASLLELPKEHYLQFESGAASLTLPDLEILAWLFDIPLWAFFDDSPLNTLGLSLPRRTQRSQYNQLRHKMIRAQFNHLMEKTGLTLEDIQEKTGIPHETLLEFKTGISPIPINNLMAIANCFGESVEYFFSEDHQSESGHPYRKKHKTQKWQPEYPDGEKTKNDLENDNYEHLVSALKQIPKKDQAQIAKMILRYLKSL